MSKHCCSDFERWADHPDDRIAAAGIRLRERWCMQAASHPQTASLMAIAKRAWREHWPDPAIASGMLFDVAELAVHVRKLEQKIAELEAVQSDR